MNTLFGRHLYCLNQHGEVRYEHVLIDDRGFIDGETPVEDARKAWLLSPTKLSIDEAARTLLDILFPPLPADEEP